MPSHDSLPADECGCYACTEARENARGSVWWLNQRMIVCETCGNKRCPHGTNHVNACTNSNEARQPGSRYV